MDTIAAALIQYEDTGLDVDQLIDIIRDSHLDQKLEIAHVLQQGKQGELKDKIFTPEDAVTVVTTLLNYAEEISLISGDKSAYGSDITDLQNITTPAHFKDKFDSIDEPFLGDSFEQPKSFWSNSPKNIFASADVPTMSPNRSLSFQTSSPLIQKKSTIPFVPSNLSRATNLSPIKGKVPQSPSKSSNLIDLNSPMVSKFSGPSPFGDSSSGDLLSSGMIGSPLHSKLPRFGGSKDEVSSQAAMIGSPVNMKPPRYGTPNTTQSPFGDSSSSEQVSSATKSTKSSRFATPTNVQMSFGSETTPTEERVAGMVGAPSESPSRLTKQLERTESMLSLAEERCSDLESTNSTLEMDILGCKKEIKDLKAKNESLLKMVHDYEHQIDSYKDQVASFESVSSNAYSRLKDTQQKLTDLGKEKEQDTKKHVESITCLEERVAVLVTEKEKNDLYIRDLEQRVEQLDVAKADSTEEVLQLKSQVSDIQFLLDKKDHEYAQLKIQNEGLIHDLEELRVDLEHEKHSNNDYKDLYEKSVVEMNELRSRLHLLEMEQHRSTIGESASKEKTKLVDRDSQVMVSGKDISTETDPIIPVFQLPKKPTRHLTRSKSAEVHIDPVVMRNTGTQTLSKGESPPPDTSLVSHAHSILQDHTLEEIERADKTVKELLLVVERFEKEKIPLKQKIMDCQSFTMDIRQDLTIRNHYDKEVERWIDELRRITRDTKKDIALKKDGIENEIRRSRELREMAKNLPRPKIIQSSDSVIQTESKVRPMVELLDSEAQTTEMEMFISPRMSTSEVQTDPVAPEKEIVYVNQTMTNSNTTSEIYIKLLVNFLVLALLAILFSGWKLLVNSIALSAFQMLTEIPAKVPIALI